MAERQLHAYRIRQVLSAWALHCVRAEQLAAAVQVSWPMMASAFHPRDTYRSWLDETGAPTKVQQELMRHASIQATMNVYGPAMTDSKRKANSQVVGLVFGEQFKGAKEALSTKVLQ